MVNNSQYSGNPEMVRLEPMGPADRLRYLDRAAPPERAISRDARGNVIYERPLNPAEIALWSQQVQAARSALKACLNFKQFS